MDWLTLEENDLMDGDYHLNQRYEEKTWYGYIDSI